MHLNLKQSIIRTVAYLTGFTIIIEFCHVKFVAIMLFSILSFLCELGFSLQKVEWKKTYMLAILGFIASCIWLIEDVSAAKSTFQDISSCTLLKNK
jgi:hypothetical protein